MTDSWTSRGTYGNILKFIIKTQQKNFSKEKDPIKKAKLASNVGYLIQIQTSLIRDAKNIEKRLDRLEEIAGIGKKRATS